jgi:methionyl-tRNA formyltransferase
MLDKIKCPIINLHISYLPFNRGAHPNFWSFFDNTPSGVSIHLIDEGIDTGPIIYQKRVKFSATERTFNKTYVKLKHEVEKLFLSQLKNILLDKWISNPQIGKGTYHSIRDLPSEFSGWNADIQNELEKLSNVLRGDNA